MATTLSIDNFSNNVKEISEFLEDYAAGVSTITVETNQNIHTNDVILLGRQGAEKSEIVIVDSVSGANTVVLTSNTLNPHSENEPVTVLNGNKIKVYRASNVDGTSPSVGGFAQIGTDTDIDADQMTTDFVDDTGGSDYWYRMTFVNSATDAETDINQSEAVRGGDFGAYCTIQEIRTYAGLSNNRYISDADIDDARRAAQEEVDGVLVGLYVLPLDPVPDKIRMIVKQLASGILLTSGRSGGYATTSAQGQLWLDEARAEIAKIKSKASTLTVNGESIAIQNVGGFSMYPDTSTSNLTPSTGGRLFNETDRY